VANIKSAKKRILIGKRRQDENKGKKAALLTAVKKFRLMVAEKDFGKATEVLPSIFGLIDSAESHGRLHKNNADRKKSRLAALLSKAEKAPVQQVVAPVVAPVVEEKKAEPIVEVEATKPVKKTAAKKTVEKKVEVKAEEKAEKPVKKTVAKKPAAKKTTTKKEA